MHIFFLVYYLWQITYAHNYHLYVYLNDMKKLHMKNVLNLYFLIYLFQIYTNL